MARSPAVSLVPRPSLAEAPLPASDAEVARGLIAGETWALAETWRRFAPMVMVTAERALGARHEAEDLTQDVFFAVFRKAKTLREPERLRSFVYSFLVRNLKYQLRTRRLRAWLCLEEPQALPELGQRSADFEARDLLRRCQQLLGRLSPREELAFILRRMDGMTIEEIAAAMELSGSTVKRALARAEEKLSRRLEANPDLVGLLHAREATSSASPRRAAPQR